MAVSRGMSNEAQSRLMIEIDAAIRLLRDKDPRLVPVWDRVVNSLLDLRKACEGAGVDPLAKSEGSEAARLVVARDAIADALAEARGQQDPIQPAPLVLALASLHQQLIKALP